VVFIAEIGVKFIFHNWQRKIISVLGAVIIWVLVSSSISMTRSFEKVLVRVTNIPQGKAVSNGNLDGYLEKRIDLSLTGSRDVLSQLSSQDFKVTVDATNRGDEWIVKLTKNDLTPLRPDLHLPEHIREVSSNDFVVRLCPLVMTRIPIYIRTPRGEAPEGYQFIDVFPRKVYHTVSVPEEDAQRLEQEGVELIFDLSNVTSDQLNAIRAENGGSDEVSFPVPEEWKKIRLPAINSSPQIINSSEARNLRIDFLYNSLIPYKSAVPISVFFSKSILPSYNPMNMRLVSSGLVERDQGVFSGVSRLFLNTVKDRMEIVVVPVMQNGKLHFSYGVQFIDPALLEEAFVTVALSNNAEFGSLPVPAQTVRQHLLEQEQNFRLRFREYMQKCKLFVDKDTALNLNVSNDDQGNIEIKEGF
jgi:hypothetical protein